MRFPFLTGISNSGFIALEKAFAPSSLPDLIISTNSTKLSILVLEVLK